MTGNPHYQQATALVRPVMGGGAFPLACPVFFRNWRTRHDSNV
jgi:hypothetical protein